MSTKARLERLEGALSPKEATLAWLAEAHQFPTLTAYVGWLVTQPPEAAPFWRVPEQAERAVRGAMRGQPRDVVEAAAHQAVRDAVFLVELVIRLNVDAEDLLRAEGLRYAAIVWEARAITAETELLPAIQPPSARRALTRPWTNWRAALTDWTINLEAATRARQILERRYLDGHGVVFPDLARKQQALTAATERLAAVGGSVVLRQGGSGNARGTSLAPGRTTVNGGEDAVAADLVEGARAAALDLLGDAVGALASERRRQLSSGR